MTTEKQYPTMATYAINDFFSAKEEVKRVISEMDAIYKACDITVMCRGDLTGRVNGFTYAGMDQATKLLVEFEKKANEFEKARVNLKKELPLADFEFLTYSLSNEVKYDRTDITQTYDSIKKFFDLTHDAYRQSPAPEVQKVSPVMNLVNLLAYVSLVYTVWHMFF